MPHPIRVALAFTTVVVSLAACAKSEPPKDTAAAMSPAPAPAPAPTPPAVVALSLGDVAGKWSVRAKPESGPDTATTTISMTATADSTWTTTLPSGKSVKNHVSASGDSIVVKSEPYASIRRKGKTVWTETVYRKQGDKLVGTTIAHYAKSGADSVLTLHSEATKQ